MPADRKNKASKRRPDDGFKQTQFESKFDLTWTAPVECSPQNIEFTPNVTPTTFSDDSLPPLQPSSGYIFPPEGAALCENPKPRGRKGSGYIPRPPNAFILFRSSFIKSQHVSSEVETNHSTLSKIIGMTWQNLPNDERQAWHAKAKQAQEEHRRRWPQYAFRPVSHKAQRKKRRVRETEPKDIKRCEKIVELLCNGKKGDELNDAVKDFDRSHVPQFVARFEDPITERAYRRSSSAPLPDTDYEQAKQAFLPQESSILPHRRRSSSVEPENLVSSSCMDVKLASPTPVIQFDPNYSLGSQLSHMDTFYPPTQDAGFIDFSSYSLEGQAPVNDSFSQVFGTIDQPPSTLSDFTTVGEYGSAPKPSLGRASLTINTSFLSQWSTPQDSPMASIPGSPTNYSASSPSDVSTPYPDVYTPTSQPMDGGYELEEAYGFTPVEQGFPYADLPDQNAATTYYPEFMTATSKDVYVLPNSYPAKQSAAPQFEVDYSTYIHPPFSM